LHRCYQINHWDPIPIDTHTLIEEYDNGFYDSPDEDTRYHINLEDIPFLGEDGQEVPVFNSDGQRIAH